MSAKVVLLALQADVNVCNALLPPVKGCNAGGGTHIVIPSDFAARIAGAQNVPGCSYASLEFDGSLYCDIVLQSRINTSALVLALPPQQRSDAALLIVKINNAT